MKMEIKAPNSKGKFSVALIPENDAEKRMLLFQAQNVHREKGTKIVILADCSELHEILVHNGK